MEARDVRRLSIEEYVALDRASDERWEYANGEAWATRGAAPEHGRLTRSLGVDLACEVIVVRNVSYLLTGALRDRPCIPFPDGQKIATPRTRAYHYPDAVVVCGEPHYDEADDRAMTNPTLLVEVLSPTTADYDRGGKLAHYRTIDSLEEYVIVSGEPKMVEHHRRVGRDQWLVTLIREGSVELTSIAVSLELAELWRDLDRVRPA